MMAFLKKEVGSSPEMSSSQHFSDSLNKQGQSMVCYTRDHSGLVIILSSHVTDESVYSEN